VRLQGGARLFIGDGDAAEAASGEGAAAAAHSAQLEVRGRARARRQPHATHDAYRFCTPRCALPPPLTRAPTHARQQSKLGRLFCVDLGSAAGTLHNGERLSSTLQVRLREGDTLTVRLAASGDAATYTVKKAAPKTNAGAAAKQQKQAAAAAAAAAAARDSADIAPPPPPRAQRKAEKIATVKVPRAPTPPPEPALASFEAPPRNGAELLLTTPRGPRRSRAANTAAVAAAAATAAAEEAAAARAAATAARAAAAAAEASEASDADAAPGPARGDPLGRRELGRHVVDWLETGAASAASRFVDAHQPGAPGVPDFSVGDAMRAALRVLPRPVAPGAGGAGAAAAAAATSSACARASAHFPTLWDHFQRACKEELRKRSELEIALTGGYGAAGADAAAAAWRGAPAWAALKALARAPAHKAGARRDSAAVRATVAIDAAASAALAARVATFCDAAEAALAHERAAELAAFEAATSGARADDASAMPDETGDASGARLLRGLVLVSTSKSVNGRRMVTLRAARGGALPASSLAAGDAVLLSVPRTAAQIAAASAKAAAAAAAAVAAAAAAAAATEDGEDAAQAQAEATEAAITAASPLAALGAEGRIHALTRTTVTLSLPPRRAGGADPAAGLAGKTLILAAAPDGVTYERQLAALARLRIVPLAPRGAAAPACAAIVAALFPHPSAIPPPPPPLASMPLFVPEGAGPRAAAPSAAMRAAEVVRDLGGAVGELMAIGAPADGSYAASLAALEAASAPLAFRAMDASQRAAAAAALAKDHAVVCVQGPPGTGKTALIAAVVARAVARGERVLCAAPANAAVDNLAERLAAAGLRVVRLGDPARAGAAAAKLSLEAQVAQALGPAMEAELGALRAELRAAAARADAANDTSAASAARSALAKLARSARRTARDAERTVLRAAQVVLATTAGAGDPCLASISDFDLAVVDEAGQSTRPLAWLPLLRARRALLVGDAAQLAPTVLSPAARQGGLARSVLEDAQPLGVALPPPPASAAADAPSAGPPGVLRAALATQYRSHAAIAGWASRESYAGRLGSARSVATRTLADLPGVADTPLTRMPMLLLTTRAPGGALLPGCEELTGGGGTSGGAGTSLINEGEADAVVRHVAALLAAGVPPGGIAVLSPYAAQVELLRGALAALRPAFGGGGAAASSGDADADEDAAATAAAAAGWVEVSSVDAYQGREADAVVISCVRANARGGVGFLADARRMNVAVTRARAHVALVADAATVGANPFLRRLLIHATDAGGGAVCVRDAANGRAPWHAAAPVAA
jgi:hypothetical protein